MWLVHIDGKTIAIRLNAKADTSQADLDEAHAIIDSMDTEPDDNNLGFRLVFTLTTTGIPDSRPTLESKVRVLLGRV